MDPTIGDAAVFIHAVDRSPFHRWSPLPSAFSIRWGEDTRIRGAH
jgi:hypothetical protein